ncbi:MULTISPECIES: flagellar biosynthesis protein FliQ [Curvibacter]|jgi:flagellar biosynthesis protein FliQ|uniref:flagellar biosynthesis protein FliQ n=1 Tax=Curvibacter TaxID=281915 RepID=UPI0004858DA5|nr:MULTISPECIES: flagellar biosynthesis protein FliQ [Curvibacter]MBV5293137.1 flagellar biosynthesis protein FliQ [Curvibacter lanceolatus]
MNPQMVLTIGREAMELMLLVSLPILLVVMVVGLVVSVFQAITQIHETTLTFVPKLLAAVAVFLVGGPWMLTTLVDYLRRMIESIPTMAG